MNTNRHSWSHLAQYFLEWEMLQIKFVKETKTHILCSGTFFLVWNRDVYEITWKNSRANQGTDGMVHVQCMLDNYSYTHTTHTKQTKQTSSQYAIPIAFPLQQWEHERATMLRYTHTVCLVQYYIKQAKRRKSEQWAIPNPQSVFVYWANKSFSTS
jgi:hypothetical protein